MQTRRPGREYAQGPRTARALYMWGWDWWSRVGVEVGNFLYVFGLLSFWPSSIKTAKIHAYILYVGDHFSSVFSCFFYKKSKKKRFCVHHQLDPTLLDEGQNERRPRVYKNIQKNSDLLHGAPETALARAGVLCVGCLSCVGSIAEVRRRVGENDRSGSKKNQKIIIFVWFFRTFCIFCVARRAKRIWSSLIIYFDVLFRSQLTTSSAVG
jgi:hypothetical protein